MMNDPSMQETLRTALRPLNAILALTACGGSPADLMFIKKVLLDLVETASKIQEDAQRKQAQVH